LGAKLDKKLTNQQAMFLPDYLLKGFDSAVINNQPLVAPPQPVLQMPALFAKSSFFTPIVIFTLLLAVVIVLSFGSSNWAVKVLSVFDFLFFFVLGLTGLVLLFMWFGTDHVVCRNNYNLLWALPTHAVMAFLVHKKAGWINRYFTIVFWLTVLLVVSWLFLPQQMNTSLVPIILLITYRSWSLSKRNFYGTKRNYPQRQKTVLP
jgi:hypothetical protein